MPEFAVPGQSPREARDRHEREADRAAEEVIRASGPESGRPAPADPGDGTGRPLPPGERAFMESRFGHSFEAVRIHTGRAADQAGVALNARAFTLGHQVVFAEGYYQPGTTAGRRLLAHELAHVVQQRTGRAPWQVQRWEGLEHRNIGNRAQSGYPFRGTIGTDRTALRRTPHKDPRDPHRNTTADVLSGATVLVLGIEHGWAQVVIESGKAQDKAGSIVAATGLTGYISGELITRSGGTFDARLPVGGGLDLTYGDLIAFGGDHFKDFADITAESSTAAGRGRLQKLQNLTENEATLHPVYEEDATITKAYAERYKNLALENVAHFAGGGTALITWQQLHRQAVLDALDAGRHGDSRALAQAYAVNAFADHYLTDSFSAGHIRTPREQVTVFYRKLASEVFQHLIDFVADRLGTRIFELLQHDYWRVQEFGTEADRQDAVARVRTQVLTGVTAAGGMTKVEEQFGLYVGGAVSKIMHDRDNDQGLKVVSKRHPEGWIAYGDGKLDDPADAVNLRYVLDAIAASKQDLLTGFRIGAGVLTRHGRAPARSAVDAAMAELAERTGPPFAALDFVPGPAPGVPPLPSWEWGRLDASIRQGLLALIARYLTATVQAQLLQQFPVSQEVEVTGPNVIARPRDAARDVLADFLHAPIPFLERAFGRPAGP